MKKILTLSTVLAIAAWSLVSCSKQTDTKVVDSQTNNSGGTNSFNWTGAEPFSAKVDGVPFQLENTMIVHQFGYYSILADGMEGTSIGLSIPENAVEGLVYSMPTPANVTWSSQPAGLIGLGASTGKIKVVTNNATTIEGYFWADTKDYTGNTDTVIHLTEGYVKVEKP